MTESLTSQNLHQELDGPLPLLYWAGRYETLSETVYENDGNKNITFYLVHRGKLEMTFNKEHHVASADHVLIVPPRKSHTLSIEPQSEHTTLVFVLTGFVFDNTARVIPLRNGQLVSRWTEDIIELWKERELDREVTGLLLATMLTHLSRLEQRQAAEQSIHSSVLDALQIIERDLSAPLSIDELARQAHVSSGYLHTLFRQQFGCSPLKYRQELRMKLACRLLEQNQMSLDLVAQQCGYQDVEYFGRVFRKTYRITPTGWRDRRKTQLRRLD